MQASSPHLTVTERVVSAMLRTKSKETSGEPSGLDGHFINAVKKIVFLGSGAALAKGIRCRETKVEIPFSTEPHRTSFKE